MQQHAIGLMSGSSLDGLDIAHCRFETGRDGGVFHIKDWEILAAQTLPLSGFWKKRLQDLPQASAFDLADAHAAFGAYLGQLVQQFFVSQNLDASQIDLIASHGHTIFHEPSHGFTTQIGDGAALAAATGCTVVADFRTADIALGGQGAPLAPMADKMLFPGYDFYLNLGGIANLTCNVNGKFVAFDVTGANQVLNALSQKFADRPYDANGDMAGQGVLDEVFLEKLNAQPFFDQSYPKSLSNQWVQENLVKLALAQTAPVENLLRTVCRHVAQQLALSITQVIEQEGFVANHCRLLATGGGVHNGFLMGCIQAALPKVTVVVPEKNIVEFKEAALMALLGVMRLEGVPNCMATVTGASRDAVGGAVFHA